MLRISEMESHNGQTVLKLEGRIVGPWVEELEKTSQRFLDCGRTVKLDLVDVAFVDREGLAMLLGLKRQQVIVEGCSPFVLQELREAEKAARPSKPKARGNKNQGSSS